MALPGVASLTTDLENLSPSTDPTAAWTAFADVIGNYVDQVQAGSLGSAGILIFNRAVFVTNLLPLAPINDNSWVAAMANAWEAAMLVSTITPGTVSDPSVWTASITDTNTLPAAATTITTIPVSKATLSAGLASATSANNPPQPLAQAFHDATLEFIFTTIGLALAPPGAPIPVPVPRSAQ